MSDKTLRTIIEAQQGVKTDVEWDFCMDMVRKVLAHNEENKVKATQYGMLQLVREFMKRNVLN